MFLWPVLGPVTRGFDYLSSIYVGGQHAAIDIAAPSGTPIRAVADGMVIGVGWDFYSGFFVAVEHSGWRSTYRHLHGQTPVVVGQTVVQSQIIGNVGSTGYSLGPHLHFDLWAATKHDPTAFAKHGLWAHDPELYLEEDGTMDDQTIMTYFNEHRDSIQQLRRWLDEHRDSITALQAQVGELTSGGVSEARVKELIRAAKHNLS